MKKKYEEPICQVETMLVADVLTFSTETSDGTPNGYDYFNPAWINTGA